MSAAVAVCAWCDSERILGRREDSGPPLTATEAAGGFFACHKPCQSKMDGLLADLASKGVFVEVAND